MLRTTVVAERMNVPATARYPLAQKEHFFVAMIEEWPGLIYPEACILTISRWVRGDAPEKTSIKVDDFARGVEQAFAARDAWYKERI